MCEHQTCKFLFFCFLWGIQLQQFFGDFLIIHGTSDGLLSGGISSHVRLPEGMILNGYNQL
jgi:hypothetical protein